MHPRIVLSVSVDMVEHPVAERLESGRRETSPHFRQRAVVYRPRQLFELVAHSNLTRQSST